MTTTRGTSGLKFILAGLFMAGLAAFFLLDGDRYLTLEALKSHRDALLAFTRAHYALALAAGLVIYAVATALSVPGATVLSLAAGLLFGRWMGTALILAAATLGAVLVFLAARHLFAEAARRRMGPLARRLSEGFRRDAFHYLLFLRLVPVFPFWLVNLVPAFTRMSLRSYFLATLLGIAPGSFVFANLGQSLGRIERLDQLLSGETLLALGLLGLFALVPVLVKRLRPANRALSDSDDRL
ncbi:MAG TPA: TVP38/TMEM64 family protein [Gammaproteobacteria bacterium]|nr:TVP38/TMEM64 family protein [Gammaproteobacteria bacterium]